MKKTLKYSFFSVLLLVVAIAAAGYYFLNTTAGLHSAIDLVNRYSGYRVSADKISGKLLHKTELSNLIISGQRLDLQSQQVVLNWRFARLFKRSLEISAISLKDTQVTLHPQQQPSPSPPPQPVKLTAIDLPLAIKLSALRVQNLTIKNPANGKGDGKGDIVIDNIEMGIDYAGQIGKIHTLVVQGHDVDLRLNGQIQTRGDFPFSLANTTQYRSTLYGDEVVEATLTGSLKDSFALRLSGRGVSTFNLDAKITTPLTAPQFSAELALQQLDAAKLGLPDSVLRANINVQGKLPTGGSADGMAVNADAEVFYQSPQTDKIKLSAVAAFDGKRLDLSSVKIDLLTAKQHLSGRASYSLADQAITANIDSKKLYWPQTATQASVTLQDLTAAVSGHLHDYNLTATTTVTTAAVGETPLDIQASGDLQALNQLTAKWQINQQELELSGKAAWQPQVSYSLQAKAAHIAPQRQFPGIKNLDITVDGGQNNYAASGGVEVYRDDIPAAAIKLNVVGTPTTLQTAQITLASLGGKAVIAATGDLSPLRLSAQVSTDNLQPQHFHPDLKGRINSRLKVDINRPDDTLTATATLEELSGTLQNKPLQGKGVIMFDQARQQLSINDLHVDIGGNKVVADGGLSLADDGQANLTANIDAKSLHLLLPALSGAVTADITATGRLNNPEITANISATQLAYQNHSLQQLKASANISQASDKLQLDIQAKGIDSGGQKLQTLSLKTTGKLSAHNLNAQITPVQGGAIPAVKLSATGGLSGFDATPMWQGKLTTLAIADPTTGNWQLGKPASLQLSAKTVTATPVCLTQQATQLCTDSELHNGDGKVNLQLRGLKTQRFAKFIPKAVALDTTLAADATLTLSQQAPKLNAKFNADGGQLQLSTGNGTLVSKIRQLSGTVGLQNQRLEGTLQSQLSKLGKFAITAVVPQIKHKNVQASLTIANDSLQFLEEILPQLNEVKGRLSGKMSLSGNPDKQLKVAGKISLQQTAFNVPQFGSQVRQMTLDIFAKDGNQIAFKGGAKAGGGDFTVSGGINPGTRQGKINIKGKNFQAADSKKLQVTVSPDLQVNFAEQIQIRGTIAIPKALIVPESSGSKITASDDVVMPGSKHKQPNKQSKNSPIDIDVQVKLGDDVRVASADIETRLSGNLKIAVKPGKAPAASGTIAVKTGELRVYGQELQIERGRVIFSNGPIGNPSLDISASRTIEDEDITVGANVLGTVSKPKLSLFSTPSMPDSSILSYLLFGKPPNSDSFGSTALLQTGGLVGANSLARDLRSSVGLDVLDFSITGMEAGKNINKKIYVGMRSNFFDAINDVIVKYKISGRTYVDSTVGTNGITAELVKEIETD